MQSKKNIKIYNGTIITPDKTIENGSVVIKNGKIDSVSSHNIDVPDCTQIDAQGCYVSPGFIDIHTHGSGGHDYMDGTLEAFIGSAEKHAQYGTTSLIPTTLTSTFDALVTTIKAYKQAEKSIHNGANFLGLHLEGPYFALSQKGAQDPRYIKTPDKSEYQKILRLTDDIIRWSAAPELDGALEFGQYLTSQGILPSIAHSDAIYDEVVKAFDNGYTHITHLYSATSTVKRINSYRYAGIVEAAYLMDDMTVEIIADGVHLPASLLKLIYKIKGPDKIALVTDSMRAAGMHEGESIIGSLDSGRKVIIEDGVAKLPDRTAFAGSVATTDRLVRTMINLADVPLTDAVTMMTSTPASIMGLASKKGSLIEGHDADIILFDDAIDVKLTIVNGIIVYKK